MDNVVNSKEALQQYLSCMFTDNGQEVLKGYLSSLINIYQTQETYPCDMGVILSIPTYSYSREVVSKDELLGRIKIIMQILAISEVKMKGDDNQE